MQPHAIATAPAGFREYLSLARLDHATKHVFILPGILLALLLRGVQTGDIVANIVLGLAAAVCIASANYVINEWLDREFDAHHPVKSARSSVRLPLSARLVYTQYAVFLALGLALAAAVNVTFLAVAALFGAMGLIYNVSPLRSKDRAVVDVLTEAINNPLRLMLGWAMVDPGTLPPASLLLGYWFGGAFLMNAKRLSEYRDLVVANGKAQLVRYRRSFAFYTENRLLTACLLYAMFCGSFTGVFLIKYRPEYALFLPFMGLLFAVYFGLALRPRSVAQEPERLFRAPLLVATTAVVTAAFLFLSVVDIPVIDSLSEQRFIAIGR
jgi:4-hydroxybenzoate polyprenyltransferase